MRSDGHAEGSPAALLIGDNGHPILTIFGNGLHVQVLMGVSRRDLPAPPPASSCADA